MLRRSSINNSERFRHRWRNLLQTALLLAFLGGYLMLLGWLIWGSAVTLWLLAIIAVALLAPAGSPQLLMKLSGARPLNRLEAPELFQLTEQLAARADLEKIPELYYLPMRQPNAMAVGSRNEPIIGVSAGLLQLLSRRELSGVLAHEVSHLRHGDLRVMQLAELASRLTGSLSWFGLVLLLLNLPLVLFGGQSVNWLLVALLFFAPQLSFLAQLGLSRVREYQADLGAVTLTKDPAGLASALQKIDRQLGGIFHYLLPGQVAPHWLRTHPPTRERIRRLQQLTGMANEVWQQPRFDPVVRPTPVRLIQMSHPHLAPVRVGAADGRRQMLRRRW